MALFNLEVYVISDPSLQKILNDIHACMCSSGLILPEIKLGEPGIGALLESLVRSLEASLIASWKPMIKLIQVIVQALKDGIKAPATFLKLIKDLVKQIADLADPEKLLHALICEVAGPLIDKLLLPIPGVELLLDLLMGRKTMTEIICHFQRYLEEGKIMIPEVLTALGITTHASSLVSWIKDKTYLEQVLQLWKIPVNGMLEEMLELTPIIKIITWIFFPIKLAQGLICAVINLVNTLVTNIFKGVAKMSELLSDPGKFIMSLLKDVLTPVLIALASEFIPPGSPTDIVDAITAAVGYILTNITKLNWKDFHDWLCKTKTASGAAYKQVLGLLLGFFQMITCIIKWFFCFITDIPQMITMFMYPIANPGNEKINRSASPKKKSQSAASAMASPPPLPSTNYTYTSKTLTINNVLDNGEKVSISQLYKKGDTIEFVHGTLNKKFKGEIAKVVAKTSTIVFTADPTLGEDFIKDARGQEVLTNGQRTLIGKDDTVGDNKIGVKKV